jgi:hypothetical protein
MQKRRMRGSCRASAVAIAMVTLGLVAAISGTASASVTPNVFPIIKFWPTTNQVTLQVPNCDGRLPTCEWMLYVNEPDVPGQTLVGDVVGSSGILTVAYPADFCGVIQADAILETNPVKLEVGHQAAVTTASDCPPVTKDTVPTPKPLPGTTGTDPVSPSGTGTDTGTGTGTGAVTLTNDPAHAAAAEAAQLPFTGIDIKPMGYIGVAMVFAGLLLATTLEKRRRALRRLKASTDVATQHAARVSRWFLGQ